MSSGCAFVSSPRPSLPFILAPASPAALRPFAHPQALHHLPLLRQIRSAAQPAPLAVTAAAASVILVAVSAWIQGALRERQQQAAMLTPEQAADKDSIFEDVGGITVHYKRRASASARPKRAFACLHGFGANETSWAVGGAAAGLAERLDAVVVAHDAPGFGLTHRPEKLADYSVERNGALAAALLERAADAAGVPAGSAAQRILIGHSLGGLAAACAAAEDPKPTALILVAPAMIVAGALQRAAKTGAEPPQQRRRSVLTLPLRLTRALTVGVLRCIADTVAVVARGLSHPPPPPLTAPAQASHPHTDRN